MEIVTIEKRTFELWKQRFENFVGRVDALCVPLRRKRDKWRKRSIPTHSERHNPPTIIAKMGLKRA